MSALSASRTFPDSRTIGRASAAWLDAFTPSTGPCSIMPVRTVDIASIDVGNRLRALDPAWVDLLAEEIAAEGQTDAIRIVARGERFQLIKGARRIAARLKLGHTEIEAKVEPEEALADAVAVRLGEIKGSMLRGELTVMERARYIAAWREIYETVHGLPKRGRKSAAEKSAQNALISGAANDDAEDRFVLSFTEAAQKALGISRRSLFLALKIASIEPELGHRLTGHPSADSRVELLILAEQTVVRQRAIVDLILGEDAEINTVADAIAHLDGAPAAPQLTPPERFYQTFSRLPQPHQEAFFELNADAIERWLAARSATVRKVGTRGAA